jgi:hypothetical protein
MPIAIQTGPFLKPHVPDFCPACDAVDHPFQLITRKVKQEFRGEILEIEAPIMRCKHCGFEIAGPGHLDALRLGTIERAEINRRK